MVIFIVATNVTRRPEMELQWWRDGVVMEFVGWKKVRPYGGSVRCGVRSKKLFMK